MRQTAAGFSHGDTFINGQRHCQEARVERERSAWRSEKNRGLERHVAPDNDVSNCEEIPRFPLESLIAKRTRTLPTPDIGGIFLKWSQEITTDLSRRESTRVPSTCHACKVKRIVQGELPCHRGEKVVVALSLSLSLSQDRFP